MDQQKIGLFLKELRKERNITQEQLAEKFNISARTVSRWETGRNMPDLGIVIELADFYDVDVRELLNGERKSEKMNEDLKETLKMAADYTETEKEKIQKRVFSYAIGATCIFAAIIILSFLHDIHFYYKYPWISSIQWYLPYIGIVFTAGILGACRQLQGKLDKERLKRNKKMALVLVIVLLVLTVLLTLIALL